MNGRVDRDMLWWRGAGGVVGCDGARNICVVGRGDGGCEVCGRMDMLQDV